MAETKGSNYVWWFFFTGSVLSGFVITLCLDGFFGSSKGEETLAFGIKGCTEGAVRDLGLTVSESSSSIGLPRVDYLQSADAFEAIMNGNHPDAGRERRSFLTHDDTGAGLRIFGANVTGAGPVQAPTKECEDLLQSYIDDDNKTAYFEDIDNNPLGTLLCMAMCKCGRVGVQGGANFC